MARKELGGSKETSYVIWSDSEEAEAIPVTGREGP
jgi:hypothetical protein